MKLASLPCLFALVALAPAQERSQPSGPGSVPLRPAELPDGTRVLRDIPYTDKGHQRQKLDLYLPEKRSQQPLPLIVWVHGGAWRAGSKAQCPAVRYTEKGYAVASVSYRLSSDAVFPAQIEDCKAAIRWLRAHAAEHGLDPGRIAAWGSSAGGHLVALLGTAGDVKEFDTGLNLDQSSLVQAVVDYFGPTDFLQMDTHAPAGARLRHSPGSSPESLLIGGAIQQNREKAARANPITYIGKNAPPFLIVHGDSDPVVPWHQSRLLFDALKQAGSSVHFHTIKGAGHGGPGFNATVVTEMVDTFLDTHLKGAQTREAKAVTTESVAATDATEQRPGENRRAVIPWGVITGRDDKDGDGKVSKSEFSGPVALFGRLDKNGDGILTREEHEASRPASN